MTNLHFVAAAAEHDSKAHGSNTEVQITEQEPIMQSLRTYLAKYAAGDVDRDEMLERVAAWPLDEPLHDPAHTLPTHQDNTTDVLAGAVVNGQITEEDYTEILHRRRNR
ncbi:hypothetical protein ACWGHA_19915 [Streptomyces xanthophaeus]